MLRKLAGTDRGAWHCPRVRHKDKDGSIPRYLLVNCVIGCVAGLFWGLVMIATNTAGLAALVSASSDPAAAYAIILAGSAAVMTPLGFAAAVGALAE